MMYYGLDCSIKDCAIVSKRGDVLVNVKTGLSLTSNVNDLIVFGRYIGKRLKLTPKDILNADMPHIAFRGRYKQYSYNAIIVASICATSNATIHYTSPLQLRRNVGIKGKTKKADVWTAYELAYRVSMKSLPNEHCKDAYCLALMCNNK